LGFVLWGYCSLYGVKPAFDVLFDTLLIIREGFAACHYIEGDYLRLGSGY
jgi:hypothetical protein